MKVMKGALRRLWRLTGATSIVVGLAVVALVGGVVSQAVAATPTTTTATAILKGVSNTASAVTTLVNSGNGEALRLEAKSGNPALNLPAQTGTAPLAVNSETRVDHLNADKLDGLDSGAFLGANGTATNADTLDHRDSTDFLAANGKAVDSSHADQADQATSATNAANADKLDSKDSTDFLGATAKAADSDKLDGKDSQDFMTGHYYIRTTDSGMFNPGPPDGLGAAQADCDSNDIAISGGYTDVDQGTHVYRNRFVVSVSQQGEEVPFTWNVGWVNDSTPDTIKVFALCLDR